MLTVTTKTSATIHAQQNAVNSYAKIYLLSKIGTITYKGITEGKWKIKCKENIII